MVMRMADMLWSGLSPAALLKKRIEEDELLRRRFDECMSLHCMLKPDDPPLCISFPITHLADEDNQQHPVPTLDHPPKIVGASVMADFIALGLLGPLQAKFSGPHGSVCRLLSSSHASLWKNTYSYDWRTIYAKIVNPSFLLASGLPFAQQMVAVLIHLLFGQSYAGHDGWTPYRRAMFHLVGTFFQPIIHIFNTDNRCNPYAVASSAAAKNADKKNIMGSDTLYKHSYEELPLFFERHLIPLRWLAECCIDQIQGRQQDLIRARGGHSYKALETVDDLLKHDKDNQSKFGIRSTERGAGNKRQRAAGRKYGSVQVRPLVFDSSIAHLLDRQISTLVTNLQEFGLASFLKSFTLDGKTGFILSPPDEVGCCASRQSLKSALDSNIIWFFCMCIGPGQHTTPCIMAIA